MTTNRDRPRDDPYARARAAYYKRLIASGELKPEPDPGDVEASSKYWRRKTALAYLSTLNAGPMKKTKKT